MTKTKYLENERNCWGETKSIFITFKRLAIAKNCLRLESAALNKYFYVFLFPISLWLKDNNENKAIRLLCVILAILFFFSPILLLTSAIFLIFFVSIWIFCFLWQNKTYLLTCFTELTGNTSNIQISKISPSCFF